MRTADVISGEWICLSLLPLTMIRLVLLSIALLATYPLAFGQADTTFVDKEGRTFSGLWPEGKGMLFSEKYGLTIGDFAEGVPNGHCIRFKPNGGIYDGEMSEGKCFGNGHYFAPNGTITTGDWYDGYATGRDTVYYSTGTIYVGTQLRGRRHGEGMNIHYTAAKDQRTARVYLFSEGWFKDGEFSDGIRTYVSQGRSNTWIITFSVKDVHNWQSRFTNRYAEEADQYYSQQELARMYAELILHKPSFNPPDLTAFQRDFLSKHCKYSR